MIRLAIAYFVGLIRRLHKLAWDEMVGVALFAEVLLIGIPTIGALACAIAFAVWLNFQVSTIVAWIWMICVAMAAVAIVVWVALRHEPESDYKDTYYREDAR